MAKPSRAAVPVGRPQRADARRNREAVLAAARTLFADQGLGTKIPDIARAANVGVGTVYRHFPTKDDVIATLAENHFERLAAKARESVESPDPWEGIAGFIRFAAQIQADDRGLHDLMVSRPDVLDGAARAAGFAEVCDKLVTRTQRSGQLRGDLDWQDIPLIARGLGSVTHTTPPPSAGRWPRLVEITLDGLRAPGSRMLPPPLDRYAARVHGRLSRPSAHKRTRELGIEPPRPLGHRVVGPCRRRR